VLGALGKYGGVEEDGRRLEVVTICDHGSRGICYRQLIAPKREGIGIQHRSTNDCIATHKLGSIATNHLRSMMPELAI